MKKLRIFSGWLFSFSALFLVFFSAGCLAKKESSPAVARFGKETISVAEYQEKLENLPKGLRSVAQSNKKEFIEELVAERLRLKEAERQKIHELHDVKRLVETAKKKIAVAKLIELEVDKKISLSPEDAIRYYESHQDEFVRPVMLRASNILVKSEEDARQIKIELDAGADFEEMARKKSLDAAAPRGGDLGFFQKGQFVSEFDEAALRLNKGELSDVVKSRFGYHLIKLTDRMEPGLKDFKSVKGAIEEKIMKERRAALFRNLVEKLKGDTQVQVDEKIAATVNL